MTGTAFAFWKFSGSTGRAAFLMNSLILGALFGAVFTFIVPLEGVRFYALVLGAAIGALSVVLTGLQAMYGGLFYVALLMFGSWNSRGIVVVVVLLYLLAAAYANVAKRLRDMGVGKSVHAWAAGVCLLSFVPIVASIGYLTLVIAPTIFDMQRRRFRMVTGAVSLAAVVAVFWYGTSILTFVFDRYLVQNDLNKVLSHPQKYSDLNVANQNLGALPPQIGSLENLQSLNACCNGLSALPPETANLSKLVAVYLANNRFTEFPRELLQLPNLNTLDLSDNQLTTLPAEIGNLSSLQTLDLRHNPLRSVPEEIRKLRNLRHLYVDAKSLSLDEQRRLTDWLPGVVQISK